MEKFLSRFKPLVTGVLSGFDRLVFRGTLLPLVRDGGMYVLLKRSGVRLLDFKKYVQATSDRLKEAAYREADKLGRPRQYLAGKTDKEKLAQKLLAEHPTDRGLVCLLSTIEPCMSFEYHRSQDREEQGLKLRPRACLHLYKYFVHPRFGWMGARIQTWFPFNVQIWLNGHEWLARQLDRRGAGYKRADNCFTWLQDPKLAARLMKAQLRTDWPLALGRIARSLNPLHDTIFEPWPMDYYWSGYQTEWSTDLLFKSPRALGDIYPALVRHAVHHFQSPDVMRFLGRKAHGAFLGEIVTSFKDRAEGVRVKHWVRGNSIKMYDKAASVLRVETTIARTTDFKVLRPHHDEPEGKLYWQPLRKGVADLHRRAQVSQASNERYLDALAAVDDTTRCSTIFDAVARHVTDRDRRVRALRLGDPADVALLKAVSRGEFAVAGLRNRDLRSILYPTAPNAPADELRRLSARVSRQLRMLRAHGILRKVHKTHRYTLTARGRLLTSALFAARDANVRELLAKAA